MTRISELLSHLSRTASRAGAISGLVLLLAGCGPETTDDGAQTKTAPDTAVSNTPNTTVSLSESRIDVRYDSGVAAEEVEGGNAVWKGSVLELTAFLDSERCAGDPDGWTWQSEGLGGIDDTGCPATYDLEGVTAGERVTITASYESSTTRSVEVELRVLEPSAQLAHFVIDASASTLTSFKQPDGSNVPATSTFDAIVLLARDLAISQHADVPIALRAIGGSPADRTDCSSRELLPFRARQANEERFITALDSLETSGRRDLYAAIVRAISEADAISHDYQIVVLAGDWGECTQQSLPDIDVPIDASRVVSISFVDAGWDNEDEEQLLVFAQFISDLRGIKGVTVECLRLVAESSEVALGEENAPFLQPASDFDLPGRDDSGCPDS